MTQMYLVTRRSWDATYWEADVHLTESYPYQTYFETEPWEGFRTVPVALATTREEAEQVAARLEAEARADRNPMWFDTSWQSPSEDYFRERQIVPPVVSEHWRDARNTLGAWWEEQSPTWTDDQRHAVWDLFDNLRFYDVTEIPLED